MFAAEELSFRYPERASIGTLRRHVQYLSSVYPPRSISNEESVEKVLRYLTTELEVQGLFPFIDKFYCGSRELRNVRALLGSPLHPRIVLTAHYDVTEPVPGADDNASGVAGLLELARLLYARNSISTTAVEFAFLCSDGSDSQSAACLGSEAHANILHEEKVDVQLVITVEMIGYYRDDFGSQVFSGPLRWLFEPASRGDFVALVGRWKDWGRVRKVRRGFRLYSKLPCRTWSSSMGGSGLDLARQESYWKKGFPALLFTDTSPLRNPNWGQITDRPDTLDYRRMAEAVNGLFGALSLFL